MSDATNKNYRARAVIARDQTAYLLIEPLRNDDPRLKTSAVILPPMTFPAAEAQAERFNHGDMLRVNPGQTLYGDDIPKELFGLSASDD